MASSRLRRTSPAISNAAKSTKGTAQIIAAHNHSSFNNLLPLDPEPEGRIVGQLCAINPATTTWVAGRQAAAIEVAFNGPYVIAGL